MHPDTLRPCRYRILITGSRYFADVALAERTVHDVLHELEARFSIYPHEIVVVHGGAKGADTVVGDLFAAAGCVVEVHRADWQRHGRAAGPIRNQRLVELGADVVLAFPATTQPSVGTRDCVRRARAAHIPVMNMTGGSLD